MRYVAVVVALAMLGASGALAHTSASWTGAQACSTSRLNVRVVKWMVGLTHTGGRIAFTNTDQRPCRIRGWPKLVGITNSGAARTAVRVRSSWYGPYGRHAKTIPTLTLKPGQRAIAAFDGSDSPAPGEHDCTTSFRYLRVTPPGPGAQPVLLSAWFPPLREYLPACWGLQVSMVVRPSAFGP